MAEKNKDPQRLQGDVERQDTGQENQRGGQHSNVQNSRLESQPGNMSGVNIEDQRSRSGNQDLASRGSDSKESL